MKLRDIGILGTLLFVASFLFFFNNSWGAPFFFHPDERNIAYAVTSLHFPDSLNPHFFAYGSLPIYSIYCLAVLKSIFFHFSLTVSLGDAIISSRIYSGIFAIGTCFLLFLLGKKLYSTTAGLLACFLGVWSIGFIQFAHFGTFELWLTFFYSLLFYRYVSFIEQKTTLHFFYICFIAAILVAIKISSLPLLIIPFIALCLLLKKNHTSQLWHRLLMAALFFITVSIVFVSTNPFVLLDHTSFLTSITYESNVATGKLPVFYTGGFYQTFPIVYQLVHVYPFLLNPILTFFGVISLALIPLYRGKIKKSLSILFAFFLLYFFSETFLFVKWTRYSVPTLPFIYLSIVIAILSFKKLLQESAYTKVLWMIVTGLVIGSSVLWGGAYTITSFIQKDTRIQALEWMNKHIDTKDVILTESNDLGTLPFATTFGNIHEFNMYELDIQPNAVSLLGDVINTSNYFLVPSQRVIKNRMTKSNMFPHGNTFYKSLSNSSRFEKVYETPCDIFCRITYLGDPIFRYEETASVFDRPTLQLFLIHAQN